MIKEQATYIAFGGMTVAINIALMLTLGMIPWIDAYAVIILVLTLVPAVSEFGPVKALPIWIATSLLILLIMPSKTYAFIYFFDGYIPAAYTVLKNKNRMRRFLTEAIMGIIPGVLMAWIIKLFMTDEPLEIFSLRIVGFWPNLIFGSIAFFLIIVLEMSKMDSWFRLYERKGRKLMHRIFPNLHTHL